MLARLCIAKGVIMRNVARGVAEILALVPEEMPAVSTLRRGSRRMNENNVFDDISRTLASVNATTAGIQAHPAGTCGAALVSVFGVESAWAEEVVRRASLCAAGRHVARTATYAVVTPPAAFQARAAMAQSAKANISPSVTVSTGSERRCSRVTHRRVGEPWPASLPRRDR